MKEFVKVKVKSGLGMPVYQTPGAVGLDLSAHLTEEKLTLAPMQRALIPTGIYLEMPSHLEAQVRARSGLALKQGLTVLNGVGTIDSDYRGEIGVIMVNLSQEEQTLYKGDRIAQLVFNRVAKPSLLKAKRLCETVRNKGGFGSTGKV
ncbi:dUTP diphosphatase [Rapidithrix thailandica]|uniref:Deoxyuridine 5'-triphosphate nucleotidohydrolase n=1 Tax=Rapidithrix thailandica TaxID=413964 RepID=A0AAW9S381_9BACT